MTRDGQSSLGDPAFPLVNVVIPKYIHLEDGKLFWGWTGPYDQLGPMWGMEELWAGVDLKALMALGMTTGPPPAVSPKRMLDAFIAIKNPEEVLRFAQTYGVLGLCAEGEPPRPEHRQTKYSQACIPEGWPRTLWYERVDHWLMYVRQTNAIVKIAAALHNEKLTNDSDWKEAVDTPFWANTDVSNLSRSSREHQLEYLAVVIDRWLRIGDIRPTFSWTSSRPRIRLAGSTFGILGLQLMFAVSKSQGLAVCDGCGQAYLRMGRVPQRGKRNFCPDCGETVASKLRKRDRKGP